MKYIALLRGVNVGGKNKVSMPLLKTTFIAHGFVDVSTYINSGNVLFSSSCLNAVQLKQECEELIKSTFSVSILVNVLAAEDLYAALQNAPHWWNTDAESKHNAIFVIPPYSPAEILAQVGEAKPEYEKVACFGQIIFWSAPLKTFSKTRWAKVSGTAAYSSITIRNANTTIKLAQLAKK